MGDDPLLGCVGFDWDEGNLEKNWESHRVAFWECEELYFNQPLVVRPDRPSRTEARYLALGKTDEGRLLFVAFTVRRKLIRPISFRDMTAREKRVYEHLAKKGPEVQ
ncbi:MAG: BrnT family toxin [Thermoanaerobaculia bacterium]